MHRIMDHHATVSEPCINTYVTETAQVIDRSTRECITASSEKEYADDSWTCEEAAIYVPEMGVLERAKATVAIQA